MEISKSKIKFMQNGELYTLLQKDEDSGVKFYYDGSYVNLATKNEVLLNMPDIQYLDQHRVFYYLHGQCIQLATYEDVIGGAYTLNFNKDNELLEDNGEVTSDEYFTTVLNIAVTKVRSTIEYTEANTDLTLTDVVATPTDIRLDGFVVGYNTFEIDFTNDENLSLTGGVSNGQLLSVPILYKTITLDYSSTNLDLTLNDATQVDIGSRLTVVETKPYV